MSKDIWICRDTREKEGEGWLWESGVKRPNSLHILGTKSEKLDAGDYCIEGKCDLCVIERKAGWGELFGNLINKENKERFENELDRLSGVKHKYLIIESVINADTMGMTLPQYKGYGPSVSKLIQMITEYQMKFGIVPLFVGDAGKKVAVKIFENIVKIYGL